MSKVNLNDLNPLIQDESESAFEAASFVNQAVGAFSSLACSESDLI